MNNRFIAVFALILGLSLLLAACPAPELPAPAPEPVEEPIPEPVEEPTPEPAVTKLDEILERGVLIVSSDPAYPPQSELVPDAVRPDDTLCTGDQVTAAALTGFDIDVALAVGERLGVQEVCFVTPDWTLIVGGSWADRWDISIGSMTITPERMQVLYFTQPYYTTPASFFVHEDNTAFAEASDLSGERIGVCAGCTYEFYLEHTLTIPGVTMDYVVGDADIVGYDTDLSALQDLALGDGIRLDAVLTAQPTGQGAIAAGLPLKELDEPVYFEYLAAAVDRAHSTDPWPLVARVTEIIQEMHVDGALLALSEQYYGIDLTTAAGEFDWDELEQ